MNKKIKNSLGLSLIIVALAFTYASISYSKSTSPSNYRSFSVSAIGKAVAIPDIGEFTLAVLTQEEDLDKAQSQNTEISNRVIEFLKSSNVEKEDIKSSGYNVSPQYEYFKCFRGDGSCPPPEITGYEIRHSILVKVREIEDAGKLLSGVVKEGANTVSQLDLTVDNPTEVENEARAEAITKAKTKAESMARAGDFKLGKLISINANSPSGPIYFAEGLGGADLSRSDSVNIEPGSEEFEIEVYLTYEIK